jgi:hypothetical protein
MISNKMSILFMLYFLLPGLLFAGEIKPPMTMKYKVKQKTCSITVTDPRVSSTCYINQSCLIKWDTSNIKNYGSVFLSVIQLDIEHINADFEGGGFPVSNTGSYQWTVPANVGPLKDTAYIIKIVTPDHICVGQSPAFNIKMKINKMDNMGIKRQSN